MARRRLHRWLHVATAAFTLVASAACVPVDEPTRPPFTDVTGAWTGTVLGVSVRMSLEQRSYKNQPEYGILTGDGVLVFSTPPESLLVVVGGTNYRDESPPVSVVLGTGTGALYGQLVLKPNPDGTLTGTLRRRPDRPPSFSPFTASWPAGTSSVPVSFVRF